MVSIIIPVYNVRACLDQCVRSALALQTECELLLVDDGSTDGSGALCDQWAERDSRVRVIHRQNGGLSAARNTGIHAAAGEHLLFLDSDDFLDPAAADRMLSHLTPETQILLGLYRLYFPQEDRYEEEDGGPVPSMEGQIEIDSFLSAIPADGRSFYMVAVRFIVRRDWLLEKGLDFLPGIYHEDEEWTQRLLCAADSVCVSREYFYQYRQARSGSITASVTAKHINDVFTIMDRCKALLAAQTPGSAKERYLLCRLAQLYLDNMLSCHVLSPEERNLAVSRFREFHDLCVPHLSGSGTGLVRFFDRLFGVRLTCAAVCAAQRLRKRSS